MSQIINQKLTEPHKVRNGMKHSIAAHVFNCKRSSECVSKGAGRLLVDFLRTLNYSYSLGSLIQTFKSILIFLNEP